MSLPDSRNLYLSDLVSENPFNYLNSLCSSFCKIFWLRYKLSIKYSSSVAIPTIMLEGSALSVKLFRCLLVRGELFDRLGSCRELGS